jgi:hypothetical protein
MKLIHTTEGIRIVLRNGKTPAGSLRKTMCPICVVACFVFTVVVKTAA